MRRSFYHTATLLHGPQALIAAGGMLWQGVRTLLLASTTVQVLVAARAASAAAKQRVMQTGTRLMQQVE
jgi:hypothetical protein